MILTDIIYIAIMIAVFHAATWLQNFDINEWYIKKIYKRRLRELARGEY